jgi:hypothetical protein
MSRIPASLLQAAGGGGGRMQHDSGNAWPQLPELSRHEMTTAISELLDYFNGKEPSPALARAVETLGEKNVRVISIELFSWLKRQQRFRHEKALELKNNYAWCKNVPIMLEKWPALGQLFIVESGRCNFRGIVSTDERDRIRSLATEQYQPVLRT